MVGEWLGAIPSFAVKPNEIKLEDAMRVRLWKITVVRGIVIWLFINGRVEAQKNESTTLWVGSWAASQQVPETGNLLESGADA